MIFGQEGPGITDDAKAGAAVTRVDRAIRIDPQHQRRCCRGHRNATPGSLSMLGPFKAW